MRVLKIVFFFLVTLGAQGQDTVRITGEISTFKALPQLDTLNPNVKLDLEKYLTLYGEKKDILKKIYFN
jgi:hypothetical protein